MAKSIIIFSALLSLAATSCSSVFYQPTRVFYFDPAKQRLQVTDLEFKSRDGTTLTGWLIRRQDTTQPSRGLVLQFHGNGENMSSHYLTLSWITEFGYDLMTFDYRGYGRSQGSPSQSGVVEDGIAAIRKAQSMPEASSGLIVYGQSLGGAVAMRSLSEIQDRSKIRGIVQEATFSSYSRMAQDVLSRAWITWPFQGLGRLLVSDQKSTMDVIGKMNPIPILVIHGDVDGIVPDKFGREIYELASNPKSLWMIHNAHHLEPYFMGKGENRQILLSYFDQWK